MKDNPLNIEIEKKIEDYLKGKLTSSEIDELWAEILKEPEYLGHLETEAQLHAYFKNRASGQVRKSVMPETRTLVISMAAVMLFAIGLFWSLSYNDATPLLPISEISYADMETPVVTRSDAVSADESVLMILEAYELILDSNESESVSLFNDIIRMHPETESATYSLLNLGIIAYNNEDSESAAGYFESASRQTNVDEMVRQKAFWFLANAFYREGHRENALIASRQAADMEGFYTSQATGFYEQLSLQMNRD